MKIQESKSDSDEKAIAQKQLWTTIPERSQVNINGGQSEARQQIGSNSSDKILALAFQESLIIHW